MTDATEQAGYAPAAADDRLAEAVVTVLRMARVLERIDAGVSTHQYRMLKLIGGGGERSARLAEKLAVAKPTLTATADSLVAAGLATRHAEPGDRRVVRLCITRPARPRSSGPTQLMPPGSARCWSTPAAPTRSWPASRCSATQ